MPAPFKAFARTGPAGPFASASSRPDSQPRVYFFVAPSIDKRPVADLEGFSLKALGDLDAVRGAEVAEKRKVAIAGSEAVEIIARAKDKDGVELAIYQLVVKGKSGGYFRLVGLAPAGDGERHLAEFRRIGASFEARE